MDAPAHNPTQLAAVPANFVNQANALHAEIAATLRSALDKARELGLILTAIKAAVPPGQWEAWCNDNLTFTNRTARNYMRIAREWPRLEGSGAETVGGALRMLTAGTKGGEPETATPDPHRVEARKRVSGAPDLLEPLGKREGVAKATVKVSVHVDALAALEALPGAGLPTNPAARRGELIRRLIENFVSAANVAGDAAD